MTDHERRIEARPRAGSRASRRDAAARLGVMAALAAAAAATAGPAVASAPAHSRPQGSVVTYPAGLNLRAVPEAPEAAELAPSGSFDPNRVADKYDEFEQAARLPQARADLAWRDVGPKGVSSPAGYSGSTEQFERVAGMGSALAVDTGDASGNTVYFGDMGGLWKSSDGGDAWTNLSDGKLVSSAVGAIAVDPAHPGDLYVGTGIAYMTLSGDAYGTGFYVSHDGGASFTRPSPNVSGWAVTVIRVTPSGLLVGTNHGLYRSTDRGNTLTPVPLPDNADHSGPATGPYANWISDIAVRPGHPDEVTVAVGFPFGQFLLGDNSVASPGNGLYRSTAGGTPGTFTVMDTSGLSTPQSSTDPIGRVSLAYGQTAQDDGVLWAMVSDAGLAAGQGPTDTPIADSIPNQTATVFNGLFRSGDDGATWTNKATPTTLLTAPNSTLTGYAPLGYSPGVQAYYEDWVATDPVTPDQVYFGLEEAYETTGNSGATPGPASVQVIERYADICGFFLYFTNITNGAACPSQAPLYGGYTTHPDQHAVAVVPAGGGVRMYSANDGGVFRQDSHSTGVGTGFDNNSWTDLNSLPTLEAWHVAMLPSGEVLVALQDNGASLSGPDRQGVQVGLGDGVWAIPTSDPNVFYVSVPGGGLFVTKDHGHNLTEIQPSLTAPTFLSPIAVDPTDPNHLVAAAENVEESLKGPDTTVTSDTVATGTVISTDWTQSFDAGASPYTDPFTGKAVNWTATALGVRGPVAYAALCATCSAYRESYSAVHAVVETNVKPGCTAVKGGGDCWHIATSAGLPPGYVASLAIDPDDTDTVYVSVIERQFLGYPSSAVAGRVFVSHDRGESFSDITGNLPRGSVWRLVLRGGQLIAATDIGMFTAPAFGGSWSRLGTGLPHVAMRDAWIDPTGQKLLVSAYGRGAWLLDFGSPAGNSSEASAPGSAPPSPGSVAGITALPNTAAAQHSSPATGVGIAAFAVVAVLAAHRRRQRATRP